MEACSEIRITLNVTTNLTIYIVPSFFGANLSLVAVIPGASAPDRSSRLTRALQRLGLGSSTGPRS